MQTLIIGIGNRYRRDDGAGPAVLDRLRDLKPAGVELVERSGEGAELIDSWRGARSVIVVDAVSSGAEPGTVHRLDASREAIPARFFHYSTHAFSLAEAVETARTLGELPRRLIIFGIEGADFGAGEEFSDPVTAALAEVVERIRTELAGA